MIRFSIVGNVNLDILVSPVREIPPPGADIPVDSMDFRTGGAAGNTGLALAALGETPTVIGEVGDDPFGRVLLEDLRSHGLTEGISVASGERTCVSIALEAPGRDRSFLTLLGSLETYAERDVPDAALRGEYVLFCGYFILPALRGAPTKRLLQRVRAAGGTTLFDCGWDPDGWPQSTRQELLDLLSSVDIFLPNEGEIRGITGLDDPIEAARLLHGVSGARIVVKLGPRGCFAAGPDDEECTVPAPHVQVVDTTGAGDGFNAGLMHALGQGKEWPEALRFAGHLASTIVSRPSSNRYPSPAEVLAFVTPGGTGI